MAKIGISLYALPGYCCWTGTHLQTIKIKNMKPNMGTVDRILRVVLAAIFAYLYFSGTVTGALGLILVILGAVFILTSAIGFCPLYKLVGLNTCPRK
jgi:hypothetical protein